MSTASATTVVATAGWAIPKEVSPSFAGEGSLLTRYAHVFRGTEINSTFYRSHRPTTYARWRDSVPPTFRFAVKLPRDISHVKRLVGVEPDFTSFLSEISVLGDRLGPLLLQLPPKFEFQPDVARDFFHMARSRYQGALAIEPRHATWFFPEAEALMVAYRVARVGADPPRAPGGDEAGGYRGLSYLRLHGSPRVYFSAYASAQLISMRDELNLLSGQRWCVFDNTASSAAAANALELQSMLAR